MLIQILENWCIENNIPISEKQKSDFEIYAGMLVEWNKKMNLTSITQENEIAIKHFIDSISVIKYLNLNKNASLIDIGTGAGFPGMGSARGTEVFADDGCQADYVTTVASSHQL